MKTFSFDYHDMLYWFQQNKDEKYYFQKNNQVVAFFIEENPDKELKKYKTNRLERFLIRQQSAKDSIRKMNIHIHNKSFFPCGIYSMIDKDKIYFIFPKLKTNDAEEQRFFADHFSFIYKPNIKKQVQFHLTVYQPDIFNINIGLTAHTHCHFADKSEFPTISYDTTLVSNPIFTKYNIQKDIIELLRWHHKHKIEQTGGMKRKRTETKNNNFVTHRLQTILQDKQISSILAFGVKENDEWHYSCFVNYENQEKHENYAFIDKSSSCARFQKRLYDEIKFESFKQQIA